MSAPPSSTLASAPPSDASSLPPPIPSPSPSPSLGIGAKKNRNKKSLILSSSSAKPGTLSGTSASSLLLSSTSASSTSGAGPVRQAPRRPAPIQVTRRAAPLPSSTANNSEGGGREAYHNRLTEQLATLELGVEFKLDLRDEDLELVGELGSGNGGTVSRCVHRPTKIVMAKKVVHIATSEATRKQILRELQIMHDCHSEWIVGFYGAYLSEMCIAMCMEFMDKGSLDSIYRLSGPIPAPILGQIARSVVEGLCYLYEVLGVMHRDVKPSNILLNSLGQIKICDFGVSGELINSVADTFVGTSTYMSPERISGDPYTVKSDVWSLGITLVELALGRFPFSSSPSSDSDSEDEDDSEQRTMSHRQEESEDTLSPVRPEGKDQAVREAEERRAARRRASSAAARKKTTTAGVSLSGQGQGQMSILELLQYIVNEPAPSLPPPSSTTNGDGGKGGFEQDLRDFVDATLIKEPVGWNVKKKGPLPEGARRPTPRELLDYPWMQRVKLEREKEEVDVKAWAATLP